MTHEKTLDLIRKLRELASRGVDGEKSNAERMLSKAMEKHGITFDDLDDDRIKSHSIRVPKEFDLLFLHVAWNTCSKDEIQIFKSSKPGHRIFDCSDSYAVEIYAKFAFYKNAMQKQFDLFYQAFIMTNDLYAKNGNTQKWDELTEQEKRDARAAALLASNLEKSNFAKQLK